MSAPEYAAFAGDGPAHARPAGVHEERNQPNHRSAEASGRIAVAGLSGGAIDRFCDAIEFAVLHQAPTEAEVREMRVALRRLAGEAHAAGMLPERLLLNLRKIWREVCHQEPGPEIPDRAWDLVVRECLHAYEAERPE